MNTLTTLAYDGPGPWILFFPLIWAAVVFGAVTVLRRTVWRGRRGPWQARGAAYGEQSPIAVLGRPLRVRGDRRGRVLAAAFRAGRAVRPRLQGRCGMSTVSALPGGGAGVAAARVVNARKVYGRGDTEVRALDGVSVDFPAYRFTAIMGPSGSGKSTLMHCAGQTRHAHLRIRLHRRHGAGSTRRPRAHPAAPRARRLRLPGLQPGLHPHGRREHHPPAGPRGNPRRRRVARQPHRHRQPARPAAPPALRTVRRPAAAGRRRACPHAAAPTSSSPTSRPGTSTPARAKKCWGCSAARCARWAARS